MIPIYYKSSEGVIVDLIKTPYRMLTETDLLNSEWEIVTSGLVNPEVSKLKKKMISPPFKIRVSGSTKEDMLNNLEYIDGVFDRDCFLFNTTKQMGRIYIGNYYRDCIITATNKNKVFEKTATTVEYVATSNTGLWKYDKVITCSGMGTRTGEIASSLNVDASYHPEDIIYTPNADNTASLVWNSFPFGEKWLQFDIGDVIDVASFSGLHIVHSSQASWGSDIDVQISDGTRTDTAKTVTLTELTETMQTEIKDITTITIDNYVEDFVLIRGYVGNERIIDQEVHQGDTIDVSEFETYSFYWGHGTGGRTTTLEYTVDLQDWDTLENITISGSTEQTVEVTVEDETFRYLRIIGTGIPSIDDDEISLISAEPVPDRDLTDLGYTMENLSVNVNRTNDYVSFKLISSGKVGYVLFDDEQFILKRIYCDELQQGTIIVQGLNNDTWTDIVTLRTVPSHYDISYDTHYEKIRIKIPNQEPFIDAMPVVAHDFKIFVQTDAKLTNDSYAPSEAIIEIKGSWNRPTIYIDNVEYGADIDLAEGHTLQINTKKKTVRDYSDDVTYENVYASRLPDSFTPIETGESMIEWSGSATQIRVTLEQARSMPKWN